MRTTGFEPETNYDRLFLGSELDRAVRNNIGDDWVESGVRRVPLHSRLRIRIALWLWKPNRERVPVIPGETADTDPNGRSTRKAA